MKTFNRYFVSSLVTFAAAFAIAIYPMIDSLTVENIQTGAGLALLFVGIRAGAKALVEMFINR